jgi:seryl-tRNA(Sec) selenium transferase
MIVICFFAGLYESIKLYFLNSNRRRKGKTPILLYTSKDDIKWTNEKALKMAEKTAQDYESFIKETQSDICNTHYELSKEIVTFINNQTVTSEEIYNLCKRIREAPAIKGVIGDLHSLHDWLIEKADNLKDDGG